MTARREDGGAAEQDSDADLIARVRAGQRDAYAELFARHHAAAVGLARRYARNPSDAEDLAAEGFANVLSALSAGSGPDSFFRAYLFTSIARLAARGNARASRLLPCEDVERYEGEVPYDDPVMAGFESHAVGKAFRALPERWQAVLWYTEVDAMGPADVAPLLGLTPNGVSALALRAREGLRQSYLQAHLDASAVDGACEPFAGRLGAHARGALSPRNEAKVRAHLDACPRCTGALLEIGEVRRGMRGIVFPLVTGLAFAPAAGAKAAGWAVLGGAGEWFRQAFEKVGVGGAVAGGAAMAAVLAVVVAGGAREGAPAPIPAPAAAAPVPVPPAPFPAVPIPAAPPTASPHRSPALTPDGLPGVSLLDAGNGPTRSVPPAVGTAPAPTAAASPAPATTGDPGTQPGAPSSSPASQPPAAAVPNSGAPSESAPSGTASEPAAYPYVLAGTVSQTWDEAAGVRTDTFGITADHASGPQTTETLTLSIALPAGAEGTMTVASPGWNCRVLDAGGVECTHNGVLKGGALPPVGIAWTTTQRTLAGIVATASLGSLAAPAVFTS